MRSRLTTAGFWVGVLIAGQTVHAGFVRDVAYGLGAIGFDYQGDKNPLSGGIDFLATSTFVGNPLDLGVSDLTLQGPISFAVSADRRGISELELSFRTAPNTATAATPLAYAFNTDVGGQSTSVLGNVFIDTRFKINSFGFYNLQLNYSSRQTVDQSGRFTNGTTENDFDLGPIKVSGNIIADILAALTEPLFQAANQPNIFADFSGTAQLKELLNAQTRDAQDQLAGLGNTVRERATWGLATVTGELPTVQGESSFTSTSRSVSGSVVPEPATLCLLIVGGFLSFRRRRAFR